MVDQQQFISSLEYIKHVLEEMGEEKNEFAEDLLENVDEALMAETRYNNRSEVDVDEETLNEVNRSIFQSLIELGVMDESDIESSESWRGAFDNDDESEAQRESEEPRNFKEQVENTERDDADVWEGRNSVRDLAVGEKTIEEIREEHFEPIAELVRKGEFEKAKERMESASEHMETLEESTSQIREEFESYADQVKERMRSANKNESSEVEEIVSIFSELSPNSQNRVLSLLQALLQDQKKDQEFPSSHEFTAEGRS